MKTNSERQVPGQQKSEGWAWGCGKFSWEPIWTVSGSLCCKWWSWMVQGSSGLYSLLSSLRCTEGDIELNEVNEYWHWKKAAYQVLVESVWSSYTFCILPQVFPQCLLWISTDRLDLFFNKEAPYKLFNYSNHFFLFLFTFSVFSK